MRNMRNIPVNWLTWHAFMGRIKQMKKMVARLPGSIIICHHIGLSPHPPPPPYLTFPLPPPFIPNPALKFKLLQ